MNLFLTMDGVEIGGNLTDFTKLLKCAYPLSDQMIILVAIFHKYWHKCARTYVKKMWHHVAKTSQLRGFSPKNN